MNEPDSFDERSADERSADQRSADQGPADERSSVAPVERPSAWLPPTTPGVPPPIRPTGPTRYRAPAAPLRNPPRQRTRVAWRRPRPAGVAVAALPLAVVTLLVLVALFAPHGRPTPTPSSTIQSTRSVRVVWRVTPQQLRHDLTKPGLVSTIDGAFDESHVAEEAGLWLTMTGAEDDSDTVVARTRSGGRRLRRAQHTVQSTLPPQCPGGRVASVRSVR